MMKYLGLVRLAQQSGISWLNFLTQTPASGDDSRYSPRAAQAKAFVGKYTIQLSVA
jgi:hypothetical protein